MGGCARAAITSRTHTARAVLAQTGKQCKAATADELDPVTFAICTDVGYHDRRLCLYLSPARTCIDNTHPILCC